MASIIEISIIILEIILLTILLVIIFKLKARFQHQDKQFEYLYKNINPLKKQIEVGLERHSLEVQNAVCINQLGLKFPVFLGEYNIDSFLGRFLIQKLVEIRPKTILELGVGSSTLLISKCMEVLDCKKYEHFAVDHESHYLEVTKYYAQLNDVQKQINFLHCPLETLENMKKQWYAGLTEKIKREKLDFVLIDGPPGSLQKESRYPALPLLYPYLSDKCIIILDDANREEEKSIVDRWVNEYPEFKVSFVEYGHGFAVLTR